jgi:enolase
VTENEATGNGDEGGRPTWFDEAEQALDKVAESLRSAWEETREPRMSALESAKKAAEQLGEAIDAGVEIVRIRLQGSPSTGDDSDDGMEESVVDEE